MTLDREGISLCLAVGPDWGGAIEVGRDPSPTAILRLTLLDVNGGTAFELAAPIEAAAFELA